MCEITIFTPVYNRAYCLKKLYDSLKEQTWKDFEWVIVNDGSTDHSDELIKTFIEEKRIKIQYRYVKNHGKHNAINIGVEMAQGRLFYIVDSDDSLPRNALDRIMYWESTIKTEKQFAGVAGCRGNKEGKIIGETFEGEYIDATVLERDAKHIIGDKAEVFYTDILQKYPFPVFENENFISESAVWLMLGKEGYKLRWFNEITYYGEYLEDGLTAKGNLLFQKNQKGFLYVTKLELSCYPNDKIKCMKLCVAYYTTLKKVGIDLKRCAADLGVSKLYLAFLYMLFRIKNIKG